jgi:hypothetical protein
MTESMLEISVETWLAEDSGPLEEQVTVAELGITVGSKCATKVEDLRAHSVRNTIRVSAMLLATWLLDNYWRLRWEPLRDFEVKSDTWFDWQLSHSLPSIGGGYVWPPLTISSDGENLLLASTPPGEEEPSNIAPVRFLNSFSIFVSASDFEQAIAKFIDTVIARLDSRGQSDTVLHRLWKDTLHERKQTKLGLARRLEALLGLDPDEESSLISELTKQWEPRVGKEALSEIAAASAPAKIRQVLDATEKAATSQKTFADLSSLASVRASLQQSWFFGPQAPWLSAREAAYKLRELWGLGSGVLTTADIAARLSIPVHLLNEVNQDLPFAVGVRGPQEYRLSFVLNRHREQSRRFDIARLLGDQLAVEAKDVWRPATKSFTVRQKFQRAFAAELLCPSEELVKDLPSPLDLETIDDIVEGVADKYQVSERLVLSHLVNRGLAPEFLLDEANSTLLNGVLQRRFLQSD